MQIIAGFPALESLNLDYTLVGDPGLADLGGLQNLQSLGLDSTYVTDKSRDTLLKLKALKNLNIYHTVVSATVFKDLKAALPDCRFVWEEDSAKANRRRS